MTIQNERPSEWHPYDAEFHQFEQNPFNSDDDDCVCQWCDEDQTYAFIGGCPRCGTAIDRYEYDSMAQHFEDCTTRAI